MVRRSLFNFGNKILHEYNLSSQRKEGNFINENWFSELQDLSNSEKNIDKWIKENLFRIRASVEKKYPEEIIWNLHTQKTLFAYRFHSTPKDKYFMDWHIDDCSVIKQSKEFVENNGIYGLTLIENSDGKYNYYLYTRNIPQYTIIIYVDIDIDCKGGEFCFLNKIIKPQTGDFIIFNGWDMHCVKPLLNGKRKAIVIKIYKEKTL